MARTLKKFEIVEDLRVETVLLTEAQAELFEEDEATFWAMLGDELDWEYSHSKAGDPDCTYELDEK